MHKASSAPPEKSHDEILFEINNRAHVLSLIPAMDQQTFFEELSKIDPRYKLQNFNNLGLKIFTKMGSIMGSALSRASDPEVGLLQSITELKTREDIHAEINALADRIDEDDSVPESIRSVIARARKEVAKREYIIDMEHDVEPQIVGNEMLFHNQDNPIVKDLLFACARKLMRQGYNFMEDIYQ